MTDLASPIVDLQCISTSDAEPMLVRFLSNLEREIEVTCHPCILSGQRGIGGGQALWRFKTQLLIDSSAPLNRQDQSSQDISPQDSFSIFSDIDISLYRPLREALPAIMKGYDICFQREWVWEDKQVNIGFIVYRRNAAVHAFWQEVLRRIENDSMWDQEVVNILIRDDDFLQRIGVRTGVLPSSFWAYSQGALPNAPCILHHANCAGSPDRKWAQMSIYRPLFEESSLPFQEAFAKIVKQLYERTWQCGELKRRLPLGNVAFNTDGSIHSIHGQLFVSRISVTSERIILHREEDKVFCVFDEFYIDQHRGRMLCVGQICPGDFMNAPRRQGYFYMHAEFDTSYSDNGNKSAISYKS